MTIEKIKKRLSQLHQELQAPFHFRSRREIMDEAKMLKIKMLLDKQYIVVYNNREL